MVDEIREKTWHPPPTKNEVFSHIFHRSRAKGRIYTGTSTPIKARRSKYLCMKSRREAACV